MGSITHPAHQVLHNNNTYWGIASVTNRSEKDLQHNIETHPVSTLPAIHPIVNHYHDYNDR